MSSYCFYSQSSQPKSSSCAMCEMKLPEDIAKKSPHCMGSEFSSLFSCILSLVPVLYYFLQVKISMVHMDLSCPLNHFGNEKVRCVQYFLAHFFQPFQIELGKQSEIKVALSFTVLSSSRPCDSCNPVAKRLPRKMNQR